MPWVSNIVNWAKNQVVYLTGRGLLGLGVMLALGAAAAGGIAVGGGTLMAIAVTVTAGAQAAVFWRSERRAERQILSAYRDEVAAQLDMKPADVDITHLREVANGNPNKGLEGNSVLKDALDRNSKRHTMQMVTSALAGVATYGLAFGTMGVLGIDLAEEARTFKDSVKNTFVPTGIVEGFNNILGTNLAGTTSILAGGLLVASSGMAVFNQIFDRVGARMLNIHRTSSYELIQNVARDISRGNMISKEQVFGVFVSADLGLAECIEAEFGKPYEKLNQRQQHLAVEQFGRGLKLNSLAYDLNHFLIDAEELAFAVVGQESGVPRKRDVNVREIADKEVGARDIIQEVKKEVIGDRPAKEETQTEEQAPKEQSPEKPANDNQQGFAERFVPRTPEPKQSFVERYAPDHQADKQTLSQIEKLKARAQAMEESTEHSR